ncbi:MAG: UDP-N-acetylmuramoyl-tripeptide--D-alanyl-D-alanine ligase [Pseudomonadota bacterium]|nr:UDP-N-acetylmuramoyl-tripeptide--D-alanyl-D-alanine ligase [Pseudomonadota bacterium]
MGSLWTSSSISNANIGRVNDYWEASGVSIDSRFISKGDLFIALKGPQFDGHEFVIEALEKGAVAAIVNRQLSSQLESVKKRLVIVEDTYAALDKLGALGRENSLGKFIAITGSVGKTTTKDTLKLILSKYGSSHATYGNQNNLIGVPLTLSRMPRLNKFGIFELGMNKPGEIQSLSKLVSPDVVIITKIAGVHTEFFSSVDQIASAKAEIFDGLVSGGVAIIPSDTKYFDMLISLAREKGISKIISFGESLKSNARLLSYSISRNRTNIEACIDGENLSYSISMVGKHLAINSLAVLAGVKAIGEDIKDASKEMINAKSSPGRGMRVLFYSEGINFTLIDETYNASPISVNALIKSISEENVYSRNILVLGDMLELGQEAEQLHRDLSTIILSSKINLVFTFGPLMKNLFDVLPRELRGYHSNNHHELAQILIKNIKNNDCVAIKGSSGSQMVKIIEGLRLFFKEAEVLRDKIIGSSQ